MWRNSVKQDSIVLGRRLPRSSSAFQLLKINPNFFNTEKKLEKSLILVVTDCGHSVSVHLDTFVAGFQDKPLHHFMVGIFILYCYWNRTGFYVRLFLKSSFLQQIRSLYFERLMLRILDIFSDTRPYLDKFSSQTAQTMFGYTQYILISPWSETRSEVIKY